MCYSAIENEGSPALDAAAINHEDTLLSEISQSQKDRHCVIPLT
jgi:hypothetical protein